MKDRKLGRGLEFLLGGDGSPVPARTESVIQVELNRIASNPYQPRKEFASGDVDALAGSIRRDGLLQPIVVRMSDQGYQIVAGERRVRACRSLGWTTIPATVLEVSDPDMLQVALAENIVRADLNPIERALAFRQLQNEFKLSHDEIGQRLGMDRSTVANLVRLLDLPQEIQDLVSRGTVSPGHARALLAIQNPENRRNLCQRVVDEGLSVREVEKHAKLAANVTRERKKSLLSEELVRDLESRLQTVLGTKVRIQLGRRRGAIVIEYYGDNDLDRLVNLLAPL